MDDKTVEEVAAPAKKQFEGFRKPEKPNKGYYHVPNEWTDVMAEINNLPELKVIEYIMRHTWGYKEYDTLKCITTDEFAHGRKNKDGERIDKGTKLSLTGVKEGIARAIDHGYVICQVNDSDKGRIKKYYGLKMLPMPDLDSRDTTIDSRDTTMHSRNTTIDGRDETTDSRHTTPDSLSKTTDSRDKTSRVSPDDHRSEKETLERNFEKEREKESEAPTSVQELPTLSQPETSSPSLSQKNVSSFSSSAEEMTPTKEAKPTPVDYALFDHLCRDKGYAADFKVPRNEKNNAAIKELREQGANAEQVEFVFNDIWDDKDPFWQQHRGNPSTVASQFTARVWKMTAPAQKRRTASGLPNWTEDKTMGVPAIVEPTVSTSTPEPTIMPTPKPTVASAPAKPKETTLPRDYSRLPQQRVVRPRTAWGRRQQAEKEAQEKVMK